jgi:hypothetical protein
MSCELGVGVVEEPQARQDEKETRDVGEPGVAWKSGRCAL